MFEEFRQQRRSRAADLIGGAGAIVGGDDGHRRLLSDVAQSHVVVPILPGQGLPPEWVDIVDAIHKDLAQMEDNISALQKLHASRLKVSFADDELEQDRDIDILTQEIQRLWRKCEANIKRVAISGGASELGLSPTEHTVRLNVMRANATRLQDLSKQYRQCQQDFIRRLKDQQNLGKDFFFDESKDDQSRGPLSLDEALEKGFTQEQLVQMQEMELNATEREKEILRIAQSINDLAQLFHELSVLVIEQGTILDRIDYNVERSLDQVRAGTRELEKAESYSKKMRTMKCLICLFLACVIEALILVGIHSDKKK